MGSDGVDRLRGEINNCTELENNIRVAEVVVVSGRAGGNPSTIIYTRRTRFLSLLFPEANQIIIMQQFTALLCGEPLAKWRRNSSYIFGVVLFISTAGRISVHHHHQAQHNSFGRKGPTRDNNHNMNSR